MLRLGQRFLGSLAGSKIGPLAASRSCLGPKAFDPAESVIRLSTLHNISDGWTEGLLTVGGLLAGSDDTTVTSEPAKNLDQKSCDSNEQSYEADYGFV